MPTIISTAVSSMVFGFIFAAYNGVLNGVLKAIGVIGQNVNWLGDAKTAMWSVLIVALWAGFGNYMIYFISGMSSISEDVYESAKIDGANGIQTFLKITLPMLSPMLKIILMLRSPGHLRIMSQSWYLQTADRTTVHRSCFYIFTSLFLEKMSGQTHRSVMRPC